MRELALAAVRTCARICPCHAEDRLVAFGIFDQPLGRHLWSAGGYGAWLVAGSSEATEDERWRLWFVKGGQPVQMVRGFWWVNSQEAADDVAKRSGFSPLRPFWKVTCGKSVRRTWYGSAADGHALVEACLVVEVLEGVEDGNANGSEPGRNHPLQTDGGACSGWVFQVAPRA